MKPISVEHWTLSLCKQNNLWNIFWNLSLSLSIFDWNVLRLTYENTPHTFLFKWKLFQVTCWVSLFVWCIYVHIWNISNGSRVYPMNIIAQYQHLVQIHIWRWKQVTLNFINDNEIVKKQIRDNLAWFDQSTMIQIQGSSVCLKYIMTWLTKVPNHTIGVSTCQFLSISSYAFCAISLARRMKCWKLGQSEISRGTKQKRRRKKWDREFRVILCCDIECSFHYLYIRQKIELTHHVPCGVSFSGTNVNSRRYI